MRVRLYVFAQARVVGVRIGTTGVSECNVHYDGWSRRFDEW
jgi:hypothetical protein